MPLHLPFEYPSADNTPRQLDFEINTVVRNRLITNDPLPRKGSFQDLNCLLANNVLASPLREVDGIFHRHTDNLKPVLGPSNPEILVTVRMTRGTWRRSCQSARDKSNRSVEATGRTGLGDGDTLITAGPRLCPKRKSRGADAPLGPRRPTIAEAFLRQ